MGGFARLRDHAGLWTLLATGWFGAAAAAVNVWFLDGFTPSSIAWHATAATVLATPLPWYYGVERHESGFVRRGLVVGLVVGVAVHPLFIVLVLLWGVGPAVAVVAPLALPAVLGMSLLGLFLLGWLTVPSGAVAGLALGVLRRAVARWHPVGG